MKLHQLLENLNVGFLHTIENIDISGIADNSAAVQQGYLFVAIKGFNVDGHKFIEQAIKAGAAIVIGETELNELAVPYIKVDNSRKALGILAKNFYKNPSREKIMIGITGTNGKTTTSYLIKHILKQNGMTCSLIGTIQNIINGEATSSLNTTPSSLELQKLLAASNDEVVVMEVSSHGLDQDRLEGISFDFCLFTNLDSEHLDYHGSIEQYFSVKCKLFDKLKANGKAIINSDNYWGEQLAIKLKKAGKSVITFGASSDSLIKMKKLDVKNKAVTISDGSYESEITLPMMGVHNLYNATMAFATVVNLSLNYEMVRRSLLAFQGVPGRFETIKLKNNITVVVDYAHTPEAILYCLTTARQSGANKVIHVFGFRGDRDINKRKEMISVSSEVSDQFILTFDDLNSVPAEKMLVTLQKLNEASRSAKGTVIKDRTLAIKEAIEIANDGDWVIITGKGHETYQQNFITPTKTDKETVLYFKSEFN
jgi:UDP-N-acetylmuramoyl-L-alanyl-D-glutamate--2,6-diaminopimelate ligase